MNYGKIPTWVTYFVCPFYTFGTEKKFYSLIHSEKNNNKKPSTLCTFHNPFMVENMSHKHNIDQLFIPAPLKTFCLLQVLFCGLPRIITERVPTII